MEVRDLSLWPAVDLSLLTPKDQILYTRREQAITDYLSGSELNAVTKHSGICRREVIRLLNRCLSLCKDDGLICGKRALLPYFRLKEYTRRKPLVVRRGKAGFSGMFRQVFDRYPQIRHELQQFILNGRSLVSGPKIPRAPIKTIFKVYIRLCREAKIPESEYPFCAEMMAKSSVATFCHRLYRTETIDMVRARNGRVAVHALNYGKGSRNEAVVHTPYQRVIFDGHRLHGFFTIKVPHKLGGFFTVTIERPWILVILDVYTRVVISWHLCLSSEFSARDVLACIRKAVIPQTRPDITLGALKFEDGAALPSWDIPETRWAIWSELSCDRALANAADWVRGHVVGVLGSAVNFGPSGEPESRSIIERFFETLESSTCHLLPSTTGSGVSDPRKDNPEAKAIKYDLDLQYLEQLLTVAIANYNATPHDSLGGRTPLEQLKYYFARGYGILRTLPSQRRDSAELLTLKVSVKVKGNIKRGRRPYVYYKGERYSGPNLSNRPDLVNTMLVLSIREDDISTLRAFLPDGSELGLLRAIGSWRNRKHSLLIRDWVNKYKRTRKIQFEANAPEVAVQVLEFLSENATRSKRAASDFERVRRDLAERGTKAIATDIAAVVPESDDLKGPTDIYTNFAPTILYEYR